MNRENKLRELMRRIKFNVLLTVEGEIEQIECELRNRELMSEYIGNLIDDLQKEEEE
jgi:hypothetical protein